MLTMPTFTDLPTELFIDILGYANFLRHAYLWPTKLLLMIDCALDTKLTYARKAICRYGPNNIMSLRLATQLRDYLIKLDLITKQQIRTIEQHDLFRWDNYVHTSYEVLAKQFTDIDARIIHCKVMELCHPENIVTDSNAFTQWKDPIAVDTFLCDKYRQLSTEIKSYETVRKMMIILSIPLYLQIQYIEKYSPSNIGKFIDDNVSFSPCNMIDLAMKHKHESRVFNEKAYCYISHLPTLYEKIRFVEAKCPQLSFKLIDSYMHICPEQMLELAMKYNIVTARHAGLLKNLVLIVPNSLEVIRNDFPRFVPRYSNVKNNIIECIHCLSDYQRNLLHNVVLSMTLDELNDLREKIQDSNQDMLTIVDKHIIIKSESNKLVAAAIDGSYDTVTDILTTRKNKSLDADIELMITYSVRDDMIQYIIGISD